MVDVLQPSFSSSSSYAAVSLLGRLHLLRVAVVVFILSVHFVYFPHLLLPVRCPKPAERCFSTHHSRVGLFLGLHRPPASAPARGSPSRPAPTPKELGPARPGLGPRRTGTVRSDPTPTFSAVPNNIKKTHRPARESRFDQLCSHRKAPGITVLAWVSYGGSSRTR